MNILTLRNSKLQKKEQDLGYIIVGLSLLPAREVGNYEDELMGTNMCKWHTPGCIASCINWSGRGRYPKSQLARARRTIMLKTEPERFFILLEEDLRVMARRVKKRDMKLACRLNLYSDHEWERTDIPWKFPDVQFYDYTKGLERVLGRNRPKNYHLTFSRSESNIDECHAALNAGVNVAVVFKDELPPHFMGHRVIDGDEYDHRFLDPSAEPYFAINHGDHPLIVGLRKKVSREAADCGFVVDYSSIREKESSTELIAV
tara:strand:+ start:5296 stop:6075 length:780 start_codon:yes stop_codon:yes gene_type:complete